jgi:aromatic ring hydroxylase
MTLRTGDQYKQSIRDSREVWMSGQRVKDVTEHPGFVGAVDTVARMFDLQHQPEYQQIVTTTDASGNRFPVTYKIPKSREDLVERRLMVETYARQSGGTMGRLPEYGGAFAMGLLNVRHEFSEAAQENATNIERWFNACRDGDRCLATSFVDPQVDRTKPAEENGLLHVVEDRPDGIVIKGCKSVATFGPASNEFMIITTPRKFASDGEVIYLAVPTDSENLKFFCRQPFGAGRNQFDSPLGSRFDEPDAWALFDNVFIPKERVFLCRGANLAKVAGYFNTILAWPWYHNLIRVSVKAELLAGICLLMTEYLNTWQFPQVQDAISDVIEYAEAMRTFVIAAEADCTISQEGMAMPNPMVMSVGKLYAVKNYARILEVVRELSGQGIIMAPSLADVENSSIGPLLKPYYSAFGVDSEQRIKLFHIAWDMACDSFAGRQQLFELFNAGGISVSRLGVSNRANKSKYIELAKSLAGIKDSNPAT